MVSLQEKVRRNDTWSLLSSAAGASPRSREMVWEFVKENWALFDERYKDNILLERIVQVRTYRVHILFFVTSAYTLQYWQCRYCYIHVHDEKA